MSRLSSSLFIALLQIFSSHFYRPHHSCQSLQSLMKHHAPLVITFFYRMPNSVNGNNIPLTFPFLWFLLSVAPCLCPRPPTTHSAIPIVAPSSALLCGQILLHIAFNGFELHFLFFSSNLLPPCPSPEPPPKRVEKEIVAHPNISGASPFSIWESSSSSIWERFPLSLINITLTLKQTINFGLSP